MLIRSLDPLDLVELPVPDELWVVVARPDQRLRTADARSVLPDQIPRATALHQAAQVAAMVAALASGDYDLLGRAIDDRIAEPVRVGAVAGVPGGQGGCARGRRAGELDLRQRSNRLRPGPRVRCRRAGCRGHGRGVHSLRDTGAKSG